MKMAAHTVHNSLPPRFGCRLVTVKCKDKASFATPVLMTSFCRSTVYFSLDFSYSYSTIASVKNPYINIILNVKCMVVVLYCTIPRIHTGHLDRRNHPFGLPHPSQTTSSTTQKGIVLPPSFLIIIVVVPPSHITLIVSSSRRRIFRIASY